MSYALEARNVSKVYSSVGGRGVTALRDIDLTVKEGEFVSLIGPSGCGKTTLVKLLAGLLDPTSGAVLENGRKITGVSGNRGVVFQNYNLFPWRTVSENIAYGLEMKGVSKTSVRKIVSHYVEVMGLKGFESAFPKELSGGMQQRVALARTLAVNPGVLLMDEPFTALDVQTKRFMQDLLLQILRVEPRPVVFVTHDVEEAVFLSDTVYVMTPHPGRIRERIEISLSRPRDLHTEYSEEFISMKKRIQEIVTKESLGLTKLDLEIYHDLKEE